MEPTITRSKYHDRRCHEAVTADDLCESCHEFLEVAHEREE